MCRGLSLGASILLCGLCHSLGGTGSRSGPQSRRGTVFPSRDHHWTVCCMHMQAQAGRGAATLSRGMGTPGSLVFSVMELQVDGTRGSSTVPCVTFFLGFKEAAPSPRSSKRPPSPEKACPVLPTPQIEMKSTFINIRSCGEKQV